MWLHSVMGLMLVAGCPVWAKKRKKRDPTISQSRDACRIRKLCAIKVSPYQQHVDLFFSGQGNDASTSMRDNIAIKFFGNSKYFFKSESDSGIFIYIFSRES